MPDVDIDITVTKAGGIAEDLGMEGDGELGPGEEGELEAVVTAMAGACMRCRDNAGVVTERSELPPLHPHCKCEVSYRRKDEDGEDRPLTREI